MGKIEVLPTDRAVYVRYDARKGYDVKTPSLTAAGGRRILNAFKAVMVPGAVSRINPQLTNEKAYEVLFAGIAHYAETDPMNGLVAGNILTTVGISKKRLSE